MTLLACLSDIRRISCDAWYLPGDFRPYIAPYWFKDDPDLEAAASRVRPSDLPADWSQDGTRVHPLSLADPRRATPILAAIPNSGVSDWNYHRETLRQFMVSASSLARPEHMQYRSRRLFAVPLIGTGFSGWVNRRGSHIEGLLTELDELFGERDDFDVMLVLRDKATFSAVQATRRRRAEVSGCVHDELEGALNSEAMRLGSLARAGELVLFTGAGTGSGAGLPGWDRLLADLADWAGYSKTSKDALSRLNRLDRAALIASRKGDEALAEQIAGALDAPHWAVTHSLLAALPIRENVTLNYDELFERAASSAGSPVAVLPYEPAEARWLLKLHGCIAPDRRADIVLTRADYLGVAEHRAALTGLVQALLVTRHMLFVGFGLTDDHLHAVIHDVRRALGHARTGQLGTALLLKHEPLQEELWRRDLRYVSVDDARRLELFLDLLLLQSTTSDAHLFDELYEDVLTPQEVALRDALLDCAHERRKFGSTTAWIRVRALLAEMGWMGTHSSTPRASDL